MKIVLLNNLFPPLKAGGAEKVVETIANLLTESGHEVTVITIGTGNKIENSQEAYKIIRLVNKFIYHRCDVSGQNVFKKILFHWQNVISNHHAQQLENVLNEIKPDLVWSHNLSGFGWQAIKVISKLNYRHWHQIHDFQLINPFGTFLYSEQKKLNKLPLILKFYSLLSKKLFTKTEMVIAPSRFILDRHCDKGFFAKQKKEIIPNPVENINSNVNFLDTTIAKKFLYIGQLENYKGINTLLKAFSQIDDNSLELRIVGQGSLMSKCLQYAKKDQRIIVDGWQESASINNLINNCNVVLYPSECFENLPTVIIEAQSMARPVVASNIGGTVEMIVSKENGFLVEAGNVISWREMMLAISCGRYDLKKISNNAFVASKKYSTENYYKLLSNFL